MQKSAGNDLYSDDGFIKNMIVSNYVVIGMCFIFGGCKSMEPDNYKYIIYRDNDKRNDSYTGYYVTLINSEGYYFREISKEAILFFDKEETQGK